MSLSLAQPIRQDAAPGREWGRVIAGVDDSPGGAGDLARYLEVREIGDRLCRCHSHSRYARMPPLAENGDASSSVLMTHPAAWPPCDGRSAWPGHRRLRW